MEIYIETERLYIRELQPADAEGMFAMDSDPEVHRYVGQQPVTSIKQTIDVIAMVRQQYIDNGIGRWAVIEKASGDFAGWTGFKLIKEMVNGHVDFYDYGYRFARRFWGKGYATESGRAAMEYGINTLKLKDIYAMTDIDNAASRRALEKSGLTFMGTFAYDAEPTWRKPGELTTWYQLIGQNFTNQ